MTSHPPSLPRTDRFLTSPGPGRGDVESQLRPPPILPHTRQRMTSLDTRALVGGGEKILFRAVRTASIVGGMTLSSELAWFFVYFACFVVRSSHFEIAKRTRGGIGSGFARGLPWRKAHPGRPRNRTCPQARGRRRSQEHIGRRLEAVSPQRPLP